MNCLRLLVICIIIIKIRFISLKILLLATLKNTKQPLNFLSNLISRNCWVMMQLLPMRMKVLQLLKLLIMFNWIKMTMNKIHQNMIMALIKKKKWRKRLMESTLIKLLRKTERQELPKRVKKLPLNNLMKMLNLNSKDQMILVKMFLMKKILLISNLIKLNWMMRSQIGSSTLTFQI